MQYIWRIVSIGGCPAVVAQWQSAGGSSRRCPEFNCVTHLHAVYPSGYTHVQNRSKFLVTIRLHTLRVWREFFVCISCQACYVFIFHPPFPDSLLLLGLPSVSDQYWAEFYFCGFCPIILPHPIHNCGHHAQSMMNSCGTFTR